MVGEFDTLWLFGQFHISGLCEITHLYSKIYLDPTAQVAPMSVD
jgi:hypothetical protein